LTKLLRLLAVVVIVVAREAVDEEKAIALRAQSQSLIALCSIFDAYLVPFLEVDALALALHS
jgi:hypothetical protein